MKRKKTTLQDISKKLGLSTAAVSKALRGHEGVSEKTRKLVFETAKMMKYKYAVENTQKFIAGKVLVLVEVRGMTDPHTISTYFYIERTLKNYGMEVAYHGISASNWEQTTKEIIHNENPLAIFLIGRFSQFFAEKLKEFHKIIIVIDFDFPYFHVDTVRVDDYHGAFLAVRHLAMNGHVNIGFIGDNQLSIGFLSRYHGFCDALAHWGLELHQEFIYDLRFLDNFGNVNFHLLLDKLNYGHLPTAFFCANDPIAFVLNSALKSKDIKTPEDISIVGFDNLDACQYQYPQLTSIQYPREHIAKQALNTLLFRLENEDAPYSKIMVQPDLVIRQSVTPPKKRVEHTVLVQSSNNIVKVIET